MIASFMAIMLYLVISPNFYQKTARLYYKFLRPMVAICVISMILDLVKILVFFGTTIAVKVANNQEAAKH